MLFYYFAIFVREKNIMKHYIQSYSFKHGIYLGSYLILFTTIFYLYNAKLLLPRLGLYSILFVIILLGYSICVLLNFSKTHKLNHYDFKAYFTVCFLILAIALLFSKIYIYILYVICDPNLIKDYSLYIYETNNIVSSGYSLDEWIQLVKNNFHFFKQMQDYVFTLIPCTLCSAIISLLMKINHIR